MKVKMYNGFDGSTINSEGYEILLEQKVPRGRIGNTVDVVIHDGEFHGSDVVSMVILRWTFGGVRIVRTHDDTLINEIVNTKGGFAVGVGGVYDPGARRFDQTAGSMQCSSAGLLWKEYGAKLMRSFGVLMGKDQEAAEIVRQRFIASIDQAATTDPMSFGELLSLFNDSYRERHVPDNGVSYSCDTVAFLAACEVVETVMLRVLEHACSAVFEQEDR